MLTKAQITEKLNANHNKLAEMVSSLSEADFLAAPAGKWTAGQQLEHIYKSVKPLTMAIGLPKMALRVLIGKANRPSRDYDAVVAKYHEALARGGKAPSSFVPAAVPFESKDKLAAKVKRNVSKLISGLDRYSEQDLDKYLLPHPLLGGLTVREMLYFTIYHCEHHYQVSLQNLGRAV